MDGEMNDNENETNTRGGSVGHPIETAPKDGTDVVVGYDFATVWIVHLAWYRTREDWMTGPEDREDGDEGWWSYVENSISQHKLDGHNTPTHWIPCPPPPNNGVGHGANNQKGNDNE